MRKNGSDSEELVPSARNTMRAQALLRLSTSVSPAIARLLLLLLARTLEFTAWYIVSINVYMYTRYCMGVTEESNGISIAGIVSLLFVATTFLLSPLWAYACDRKLGHYKVLIVALIPYTIGGVFIYASSLYLASKSDIKAKSQSVAARAFYFTGISVVAVCGAAVRAVMLPYMLEQLAYNEDQRRRNLDVFVSWAYFAVNCGALVGQIYSSMLRPKVWSELVDLNHEPDYRRQYGHVYILVPVCLFLVLSILIVSRKRLRHSKPDWKPFPSCSIICRTAWYYKRARDVPLPRQWKHGEIARRDNAIKLGTIVPYVTSMLFFFVVQIQYATSFPEQTVRLAWPGNSDINATMTKQRPHVAWSLIPSIINPTAVLITVPLMLFVIRPLYERCVRSLLSFQVRMRLGMFLAGLACLAAAVVQWKAGDFIYHATATYYYHHTVNCCYSRVSMLYQVPQYFLIGVAEVFTIVSVREFVLGRAPREYKTIAFSMLHMLSGVADVLSFAIIEIIKKAKPSWYFETPRGSSCQHQIPQPIWNYFVLLAWFTIGSLAFFIFADIKYHGYTRKAPYTAKE